MTLRSSDGVGFGFDIFGDTSGSIAVQSVHSGGPAQQSGVIQPGKWLRTRYIQEDLFTGRPKKVRNYQMINKSYEIVLQPVDEITFIHQNDGMNQAL